MPNSDFFCGRNTFFFWSRHCAAVLFSQVPKKCSDLDLRLLYILTFGAYSKFARKYIFPALGVCFPQTCSSAGRWFAASKSLLHYYWRIVSQRWFRWNALYTGFYWESAFVREITNSTLSGSGKDGIQNFGGYWYSKPHFWHHWY